MCLRIRIRVHVHCVCVFMCARACACACARVCVRANRRRVTVECKAGVQGGERPAGDLGMGLRHAYKSRLPRQDRAAAPRRHPTRGNKWREARHDVAPLGAQGQDSGPADRGLCR